jgi:hypothetical protein
MLFQMVSSAVCLAWAQNGILKFKGASDFSKQDALEGIKNACCLLTTKTSAKPSYFLFITEDEHST